MSVIDTRFLFQDEHWTPDGEHALRLDLMTQRHLSNVLEMLRRNAKGLKLHYEIEMCLGPQPQGDAACDAFDSGMDQLNRTPDLEWLNSTPLVNRLRVLTGEVSPNAHVPLSF